jgi:hypothetical protein
VITNSGKESLSMGSQPGAAKKQSKREREKGPDMPKREYATRVQDQAAIAQKLGPARLQEARDRLCSACIFKEQHGAPCRLLPIDTEGKDCPYYNRGDQYPKEVEWNG